MELRNYEGREQAYIKHFVLTHYLNALALKVGQFREDTTFNYVDGFSGPWDAQAEGASDSSPALAMTELTKAANLIRLKKPFTPRCMFVEKDVEAYARLQKLCEGRPAIEARPFCGEFATLIEEAVKFAAHGLNPFAFVFLDPKGWTGFGLKAITPLLRVKPSEVLINFMLKDARRFIDDEGSSARASFELLFGQPREEYSRAWSDLTGTDRDDAIIHSYCERVRAAGGFSYCVSTIILNPRIDRAHYHLVYATRSLEGLATFRATERKAMERQKLVRAEVKATKREKQTRQSDLFDAVTMDTPYVDELRDRYQAKAKHAVRQRLTTNKRVPYDGLVADALSWPMTSEADLKEWLDAWKNDGEIAFENLPARGRVPKRGEKHYVRLVM